MNNSSFLKRTVAGLLDSQTKKLIRNSSWVFVANGLGTVLAFLRSIIITRNLGVQNYGTYVVLVAFVETTGQFFDLNFFAPIIKYGAEFVATNRNDKLVALIKLMCLVAAALGCVFLLVICVLSLLFRDQLKLSPDRFTFVVAYACALVLHLFRAMAIAALRLFYRFRLNSIVQMLVQLFEFGCVAFALFVFPNRLDCFFVAVVGARSASSLCIILAAVRELAPELQPHYSASISTVRRDVRQVTEFVFRNSASRTVQTLINSGDVLIVGLLGGEYQAGIYSVAKKLAQTFLRLTDPLMQSIFPQLAQLTSQRRQREITGLLKRVTWALLAPCAVFLVCGFFLKQWLIVMLYGSDFSAAAWPFFAQQIVAALTALTFWSLPLMQSLGRMGTRFLILLVALLAGLAVAWPAVTAAGALGGAIASLVANIVIHIGTVSFILFRMRVTSRRTDRVS